MSAIGDYIHATSVGYCRHGEDRDPFWEPSLIHNLVKQRTENLETWNANQKITPKIKQQLKNEIQNNLSLLKGLQGKNLNEDITDDDLQGILLFKEITDLITLDLSKTNIQTWLTTNAIQGSSGFEAGQTEYLQSEIWQEQVITLLNQLIIKINNNLMEISNDLVSKNKVTTKLDDINNSKEELLQKMAQINYQQGKSKQLQKLVNSYFKNIKQYISHSSKFNKKDSQSLSNDIKNFVAAVKKRNIANNISGQTAEALVKIIGPHLDTLAEYSSDKEIKSNIIGQERSQRFIDNISTEFVDIKDFAELKQSYQLINNNTAVVTAQSAEEKIDVSIALKEDKSNGIFASIKNYNSEGLTKISFESKNTLSLLWNENGDQLINHFLNLCSINPLEDKEDKNCLTSRSLGKWNQNKNEINQYIRKLLLQKLISGQGTAIRHKDGSTGTMNSANVFIVINSDTFEVKIFNMGDLLKFVQNKNNRYLNYEGLLPEIPMINNPLSTFSSAKARITYIIRPLWNPTHINVDITQIQE